MAPQVTVVSVADRLWQSAVMQLSAEVDGVLIDVSEPSEALAWELRQIIQTVPAHVFVAEAGRLHAWNRSTSASEFTAECRRSVLEMLSAETVFLYSVDDQRSRPRSRFLANRGLLL